MPLTRLATDAFGVVTIVLVSLFTILGLLCIFYSVYFRSRIRRQGLLQLGYFNGPWLTRIAFILAALWWSFGEIIRLSLLKGKGRLFTSLVWQKNICEVYIISNIGFAEPSLFLMLVFLLHASMQKRESGTLSHRWNGKTVGCVLLLCIPIFVAHLLLVFVGSQYAERNPELRKYLSTSYLTEDDSTCTYPLISTATLGFYSIMLISYISYIGARMVSLVINKGLQRRVYILIFSVILFLPMRIILLGFSVLPHPGSLAFEALVFLAFLVLLSCALVGICMLVYYPVADSLALRGVGHRDIEEMPFDDYYCASASLIANQSHVEIGRNSDASPTEGGSISFRTMIKDEPRVAEAFEEVGLFNPGTFCIVSPSESPSFPSRPMVPL